MITGIIAEYNPFHNGHQYQIDTVKGSFDTAVVAVMSGNFVQRGEPALADKFSRTRTALMGGIDVVIELPSVYASSAADIFALGAVDILNKINADKICFGSEGIDMDILEKAASLLSNEPDDFKASLKKHLSSGASYPNARLSALSELIDSDLTPLSLPNNILALEYCRAIKRLKSKIEPFIIRRISSGYNDTELCGKISSASAIRQALIEKNEKVFESVPPQTADILKNITHIPSIDDYSDILRYILIKSTPDYLSQICDITEGLENRILKLANIEKISDIVTSAKTKRYTRTKIQRALTHILLDVKKSDILRLMQNGINEYVRVLGFRKDSSHVLSEICRNSTVPVIASVKGADFEALKKELFSSDLYYLKSNMPVHSDFITPLVVV